MAPDRGDIVSGSEPNSFRGRIYDPVSVELSQSPTNSSEDLNSQSRELELEREYLAEQASADTNFTIRGLVVGCAIGIVICFSNTYFGLQTGWVSGMVMPAALIGFAFFKTISRWIDYPFTPVENVLVQTVAGAVGTMPLGAGLVGVIPALNYLVNSEENGPIDLSLGKLIIWSVGLCFFGVFVAVPLRREVIIREKLRFPSGTATALMINVLHDKESNRTLDRSYGDSTSPSHDEETLRLIQTTSVDETSTPPQPGVENAYSTIASNRDDWKSRIRLLIFAFIASFVYTLTTYFVPSLRNLPVFGTVLAHRWVWTLNPSPAYVGQGIIMGPETTAHMLFGAILGWAVLSPIAKNNGWRSGPVGDWETGSKGWIVWVSLAIMLADSIINLIWLVIRPLLRHGPHYLGLLIRSLRERNLSIITQQRGVVYSQLENSDVDAPKPNQSAPKDHYDEPDAPAEHQVSNRVVYPGFVVAIVICVIAVHVTFPAVIPLWANILAVVLSLLLSLMGVRALGETDLNPVSGISKLTQLIFAALLPSNRNAVILNLVAGAVSESAALQAGDMMQDLKAGHIIGASPKAQFYGQLIGSFVGSLVSAAVYKLYTDVYSVPSDLFQVPTGYVWVFTARLVTGKGLPEMAAQYALVLGCIWIAFTAARIFGKGTKWQPYIPGGVAVAVGMYNEPSFTLARAFGGLLNAFWLKWKGADESGIVVLASGLILGEGVGSIANLVMASAGVPHL